MTIDASDLPPIPEWNPYRVVAPSPVWQIPVPQPSIDLRDWFAGLAMQGFCVSQSGSEWANKTIAREAYLLADAMLKERNKNDRPS